MRHVSSILLIALFAVCLPVESSARLKVKNPFDGDRTGLIFGMSTGGGVSWISSRNLDASGEHTRGTVAMISRMGYGVSDRVQIYGLIASSVYAYKLWEHYESLVDWSGTSTTYVVGLPFLPMIAMFTDQHLTLGLGATYYARSKAPCWYADLAAGVSMNADPDEHDNPSVHPGFRTGGPGVFGAIGYEIRTNFMVGLNLMWGREKWETDAGEKSWTAFSAMLTIGFVAY